jgi:hypothetical protein
MDLTWFRADTSLASHDKVIALVETHGTRGKQAGFVYFCALGHAVGHSTDGVIKRTSLKWVHGTSADAALLVAGDLWEVVENGWRIRNFGTRQVVGAAQQAMHDAKSSAGKKGAEKRWGDE